MPHCPICGVPITCPGHDHSPSSSKDHVGSAVKRCPLQKGALWAQILDENGKGVGRIQVSVKKDSAPVNGRETLEDGFAAFDPLDEGVYEVSMPQELPESHKATHKAPEKRVKSAPVAQGEIAFVKFKLVLRKPKIEVIDRHDFQEHPVGHVATQKISIRNAGDADLILKKFSFAGIFPEGKGNAVKDGVTVAPGKTVDLELNFAPTAKGDHTGDLVIESNDPDFGTKTVKLLGKAVQKLSLDFVDPNFAASVEDLDIKYSVAGMTDADVLTLSFLDESGKTLFRRDIPNGKDKENGQHPTTWDGKGTDGKYVNPMSGKCKVVLEQATGLRDEKPFCVLYHGLHLEAGDWLPKEEVDELESHVAGQKPNFAGADASFCADARTIRWTWYQLASQGYYPGPHVTSYSPSDVLGKAIRRFRQAVPKLYEPVFTVQHGKYIPDAAKLNAAASIDGPLLKELASGTHKRMGKGADKTKAVLTDEAIFADAGAGKKAKLFADVDRFYYEDEFENGRAAVHKEWVLPPLLCLKAKVTLKDKKGGEVDAKDPSALGPFQVKWSWKDRALDNSTLPPHSKDKPSRVKEYIEKVAQSHGSYEYKNSRVKAGGLVDGANRAIDDNVVFVEHDLYAGGLDGSIRWSGPAKDGTKHKSTAGTTMVFFRSSIIGGDNYTVSASIEAGGLKASQTTGEVEVWRRVTIGAYVKWGDVTKPTAWDAMQAHFRHAYVELVGPLRDMEVSALPAGPKQTLKNAIDPAYAAYGGKFGAITVHHSSPDILMKFSEDYWFPEDPRSVEFSDTPEDEHAKPANIVNHLLIGTMAPLLRKERDNKEATTDLGRNSVWIPPMRIRKEIAAIWQASATAWIKAVGDHFQPQFQSLEGTYPDKPSGRKVKRIECSKVTGCPANRSAILDALIYDVMAPAVTQWQSRTALSPDNQNRMKTLALFLSQIQKDSTIEREQFAAAHPLIIEAVSFYRWLILEDNYLGKTTGMGIPTGYAARDVDIDVYCTNATDAGAVKAAYGAPTFTANSNSRHKVFLKFNDANAVDPYDYVLLRKTVRETHKCSPVILRGAAADPVPRFVVDDLTDNRIDAFARAKMAKDEVAITTLRLATAVQMPLKALSEVLDSVVRHKDITPEPVPGGTVVILNFAMTPGPKPIKVGMPGVGVDHFSSPQNIAKDGGIVLIAKETDMERGHLYAHEVAHCLFLRHWQQFNENIMTDWSVKDDHDLADYNCIMSYSKYDGSYAASHFGKATYQPEFCGKCNLKLRGWDLTGLPASSRPLKPVFPPAAANKVIANSCPDLVEMHALMMDLMTDMGTPKTPIVVDRTFPAGNQWIQLFGAATVQVTGGKSEYKRTAEAITQKPGNAVIPAATDPWIHSSTTALPDATLLTEANAHSTAAWEELLDWVYAKGGTTNAPTIIFNGASARYFDPGTPFHEFIHLYQAFDTVLITEGFVDIAGAILSIRFERKHNANIPFLYNPSYLQSTQFMADEILPRLGLKACAKMFFVTGKEGLVKIFKPGMIANSFDSMLNRGPHGEGPHTYEPLRQAMLPVEMCPEPETLPKQLSDDLDEAIRMLHAQIDSFAESIGQARPSSLGSEIERKRAREKVTTMARLKFKFEVWKDQRDEAKRFREDVAKAPDSGEQLQVHGSAPYIEAKHKEMQHFNRLYMACGGSDLAP